MEGTIETRLVFLPFVIALWFTVLLLASFWFFFADLYTVSTGFI